MSASNVRRAPTLAKRLACFAAGGAVLLAAQSAAAVPAAKTDAQETARRISNRVLEALAEANGVPGMAGAVWSDGELAWTGETGFRDVENRLPVDKDTLFRLASVSKVFAAVAAAKLHEQGELDVDRPVQASLDYLSPKWLPITTRQLAAHTAGIPHYQAVDENRGGRRFASVRESVGVFSDRDLLFAPGAGYNYSSYGYTLLTAVVEHGAGLPYLDFVADEIVPGLAIGPDATDQGDPAASRAYDYQAGALGPAAPHDYSYSWGGAGLGATAGDLARFGGRLLSGAVVSKATFEWMLEPARLTDGTIVSERDFTVGFGLRSGKDTDGERVVHHAGVTSGARSVLLLYPDRNLAVSLLSNAPWVASIEQTAVTLSAPFRDLGDEPSRDCPLGATRYEADFDGQKIDGTARFVLEDGLCSGMISADGALAAWLNGFPQKDAQTIRIIGLDARGGFSRAAFVTPIGAFDLRAQDEDGRHLVRFGGARTLSIAFRSASGPSA